MPRLRRNAAQEERSQRDAGHTWMCMRRFSAGPKPGRNSFTVKVGSAIRKVAYGSGINSSRQILRAS